MDSASLLLNQSTKIKVENPQTENPESVFEPTNAKNITFVDENSIEDVLNIYNKKLEEFSQKNLSAPEIKVSTA